MDSISRLYRRKAALMELAKMLDMDSKEVPGRLYDKLVEDLIATNLKMTMWWKAVAEENSWDYKPDDTWKVDFDSQTVYIV